jgi:hypothetical protein
VWFPAVLGFAVPAYYHEILDLTSSSTASIALLFIPFYSLPFVLTGWLIGLVFDRRVFVDTAAESAAETGQFGLRSLFVAFAAVGIACGLIMYEKRRMDANLREGVRHGILDGNLDPESARDILGDEVDTLKASVLTESEIREVALAEVTKRTSHPPDQLEPQLQFLADHWRVVVWRLPKTPKGYYVVSLSKSGRVMEFVAVE